MYRELTPVLIIALGKMNDNLQWMEIELDGMIPAFGDDVVGQKNKISRMQKDIADMEMVIEAIKRGRIAFFIFRVQRVLKRKQRWLHAQYTAVCVHIRIRILRFHMWSEQKRQDVG